MVKTSPHRNRLSGREMVAGAHALSDLPEEITTPGRGQIRAMVINCGNPAVSGPDGARLDEALAQLDLLVAIDFVQRGEPPPGTLVFAGGALAGARRPAGVHQQHARRAVPAVRGQGRRTAAWRASAMADLRRPRHRDAQTAVARQRAQRIHQGHPPGRRAERNPRLKFTPHRIDRLVVATGRKINGRRIRWRDVIAHPHGWVLGPREFGHFREALRTPGELMRVAPAEFVARTRELLGEPYPEAPTGYPFLMANRRHRHSMNSWLNELPRLHPAGKRNEVLIHPDDAAVLGVGDGDRVRVFSPVGAIELRRH